MIACLKLEPEKTIVAPHLRNRRFFVVYDYLTNAYHYKLDSLQTSNVLADEIMENLETVLKNLKALTENLVN
jgi:hypothetical protein